MARTAASVTARLVTLEEVPELVGTRFEGATMQVTLTERNVFENLTHVTEAYPEPDPVDFPPNIVEGFHTLALIDAMSSLVMRFDPDSTYAFNYGLDRVRFTRPVPVGASLTSTFEVLEARSRGAGYQLLRRCTITVLGHHSPALIADWWVLVLPQSEQGSREQADTHPSTMTETH